MKNCRYYKMAYLILVVIMSACTKSNNFHKRVKDKPEIPKRIKKLKNLTIYATDSLAPDTIELVRKTIFKSNKDVFIKGYIDATAIDDKNRVYISAGRLKTVRAIYVFGPDGRYITTMGRIGKGPGEFLSISAMHIHNKKLYVFDPRLQRISIFSTHNFSFVKDIIIQKDSLEKTDKLAKILRVSSFYVIQKGNFLVKMSMFSLKRVGDVPHNVYYSLSSKGMMIPGAILDLPRFQFYFPKHGSRGLYPFPMPFTRSSLVTVTNKGDFYVAWTEDFLIKYYDQYGKYRRAFYYPIPRRKLSIKDFDINRPRRKVLDNYDIPKTWPDLHTMLLDDKNRLWVFTITDSKTHYKGWVLNNKGKLLARFDWPGKRTSRTVMAKPLMIVKNGYFYTQERNLAKGIDQIVKYKIHFKKN